MLRSVLVLIIGMTVTSHVFGQSDEDRFQWQIAPYLWAVGIDGSLSVGSLEADIDVDFGDILDDLDFGGSLFFSGRKGRHGFHLDYTYLRLKPDPVSLPNPPFPSGAGVTPKLTFNILEGGYNHFLDTDGYDLALIGGVRYIDMDISLSAANLPLSLDTGPSITDFFGGVMLDAPISDRWSYNLYGTVGGGDSDLPWTLQLLFKRGFSNDNQLVLGARLWNLDFTEGEGVTGRTTTMDVKMMGLMIGYIFN
jgi:hypothetical protein